MKLVPNKEFITQQKQMVSDFKKGKVKVSKRKFPGEIYETVWRQFN